MAIFCLFLHARNHSLCSLYTKEGLWMTLSEYEVSFHKRYITLMASHTSVILVMLPFMNTSSL